MRALDYFIVPESLWPVGLIVIVIAAMRIKYDSEAAHIMKTIKKDYLAMTKDKYLNTKRTYYVCNRHGESDQAFHLLKIASNHNNLCPFPKPLKERIQCLADAAFLQIHFNREHVVQGYMYPWSFTVDVHVESL